MTVLKDNIKCLVIDDDQEDHEIFLMALAEIGTGFQCMFVHNAIEALSYLSDKDNSPDFIFVDMNMPKINGSQCLQEIRKNEKYSATPIYMYSTSSDDYYSKQALANGATGFITKPSRIGDLSKKLKAIFATEVI